MQEQKLRRDHEQRLEEQCDFVLAEDVEVESRDIGEEEDEADIRREGAHGLVEQDEPVLEDVPRYWRHRHP